MQRKFASAEGTANCTSCPIGRFVGATGSDDPGDCIQCEPGRYAPSGAVVCGFCASGRFLGVASDQCIRCPVGKHLDTTGKKAQQKAMRLRREIVRKHPPGEARHIAGEAAAKPFLEGMQSPPACAGGEAHW